MNMLSQRVRPGRRAAAHRRRRVLGLAILIGAGGIGLSQTTPSTGPDSAAILQFLNQTIVWYRQMDSQRPLATEPEEVLLVNEDQQTANEAVSLAFDFARAEAGSMEKQHSPGQIDNENSDSSRYQALLRLSTTLDQQIRETQLEIESLRQKLATATGREAQTLQAQIAEVQSELNLDTARRDELRSMADFVAGSSANGLGATGLREQIEALARTVPAALAKPSTKQQSSVAGEQTYPARVAGSSKPEPSGVWQLAADLVALSRQLHALGDAIQLTDSLSQESRKLRTPLVNRLRELSKQGDDLAKQADTASQAQLAQEKKDLDALTKQFKQASASVLPLSKLGILLDLYKRNLTNWQTTIKDRYASELRSLVVRLVVLVLFLAAAIGAAELWRRTIFRYVHEVRRRHQYLLLRKIVLWCVIAIILVFSFASEISSAATFAGLFVAGIAVALQNVILSIAGYFFLIGKFGIRVGDRVQVAGVTGEVVDIGLVRFHLLELISGGGKIPSGRVVAFSNSIVFQSNAGLFKQIPGTNFVWHEVTLTVSSDGDYGPVEERLRGAVEAVFSEYREEIEKQYRQASRTLAAIPMDALQPKSRLHLTQSGLKVVIRYPVDLLHATEIDDRVTRALLSVIDSDPKVKPAGPGAPGIKLKTELSSPD